MRVFLRACVFGIISGATCALFISVVANHYGLDYWPTASLAVIAYTFGFLHGWLLTPFLKKRK